MGFFDKLFKRNKEEERVKLDPLDRDINMLYEVVVNVMGADNLVVTAGKMDALRLMRSEIRGERLLALNRIVYKNPSLNHVPSDSEIPGEIAKLTEDLADLMARRTMEDRIERKISEKLEQEHADYVKDIRLQVLKEEKNEKESAHDKKKREELEALEKVHLTESVMELLRPKKLDEIVGQERAVKSLMAKLSSPYPQHLILYGPPGVGKTTAARLVLEVAKQKAQSPFGLTAPFVETDGTTLRWDPRDITNPLLGSVHDPIYQGAQKSLADIGVPEPKPGLVTDAHGGILFIDEIGEMDEMLQNKLLKVLEDKRAFFESAYYDPADEKVPPYIRKLFEEGAPADFVLIGATTRDAKHINPALRSRCAEIYFEPLTPKHIVEIVQNDAKKLDVTLEDGIAETIAEYTIEGRKAINILADAYSLAIERDYNKNNLSNDNNNNISLLKIDDNTNDNESNNEANNIAENFEAALGKLSTADNNNNLAEQDTKVNLEKDNSNDKTVRVTKKDIYEVAQVSRLSPYITKKGEAVYRAGHIFGLGVAGFLGSAIEIEAVAFPAHEKGKGTVRFNETAGSMAKDSVFNAASVMRHLTGKELSDYDLHINVIGGGNIDGPSAGTAILAAIISAVTGKKIRQNVAVTGEISLAGRVRPVGGVFEKAYGAKQAGMKIMVIPKENEKDIPKEHLGLDIHPVETAEEAFKYIFEQENNFVQDELF